MLALRDKHWKGNNGQNLEQDFTTFKIKRRKCWNSPCHNVPIIFFCANRHRESQVWPEFPLHIKNILPKHFCALTLVGRCAFIGKLLFARIIALLFWYANIILTSRPFIYLFIYFPQKTNTLRWISHSILILFSRNVARTPLIVVVL